MELFDDRLMGEIRSRFAHVASCPFEGERVFLENAGGALTLNSVVETSARLAAIPDNQGRDNPASARLMEMIAKGCADAARWMGAEGGQVIVGESGTELLFRMIRAACLGAGEGEVLGSTLEHPASRSAARRWAEVSGRRYVSVPHDDATGTVTAEAYAARVSPRTRVATIIHTSPVTGMSVDVPAIARVIREASPDCFVVIDGIQHAAHGGLALSDYLADGYAVSPYKVFSRHGYGVAWLSDRLAALPHDRLIDAPERQWELGTRDTAAYATFSDVVEYFEWLGGEVSDDTDPRARIEAASRAIRAHEAALVQAMLHGAGNLRGLVEMERVTIIGGAENERREGLVSLTVEGMSGQAVVEALRQRRIRAHVRKNDHYSGNILNPLGLDACVRISLCHYNDETEVIRLLEAMRDIAA